MKKENKESWWDEKVISRFEMFYSWLLLFALGMALAILLEAKCWGLT
ncbi:MAG: hypothetical protein ACE5ES_06065 [Candidatus Nanoarchaeia archaeon]